MLELSSFVILWEVFFDLDVLCIWAPSMIRETVHSHLGTAPSEVSYTFRFVLWSMWERDCVNHNFCNNIIETSLIISYSSSAPEFIVVEENYRILPSSIFKLIRTKKNANALRELRAEEKKAILPGYKVHAPYIMSRCKVHYTIIQVVETYLYLWYLLWNTCGEIGNCVFCVDVKQLMLLWHVPLYYKYGCIGV